jgi:ABC-type transport system involved in multi-copper enzyme maturation permease subunit
VFGLTIQIGPGMPADRTAVDLLHVFADFLSYLLSLLIQAAIALRAAAAISSERERGTWDALLASPLTGEEIVWSKLWGSLHAVAWILGSTIVAWTWAVLVGACWISDYFGWVVGLSVKSAFLAALGVRASLSCQTATRALALTAGLWLGAIAIINFSAGLLNAFVVAGIMGFSSLFSIAWSVTAYALYAATTIALAAVTSLRFDRIAGRMSESQPTPAARRYFQGPLRFLVMLDRSPHQKPRTHHQDSGRPIRRPRSKVLHRSPRRSTWRPSEPKNAPRRRRHSEFAAGAGFPFRRARRSAGSG